ncbi:hypothetical protein [Qipengyuania sp. 902]|uniref:hypothetical protein n=1 Tax=Qipengyuania sp. 902 TaxID=3417565 RepID=UPI003EBA492D
MRLFTAEDIKFEPVVMMALHEHDVISSFHWALMNGFGFWPSMDMTVRARHVNSLPRSDDLWRLLAENDRGFATLGKDGWKRVPYRT